MKSSTATCLAAGDFIMQEPREGEAATEQTDTWVFFDSENLYIAARCWEDHPERWVVTELRHDNGNIIENENLSVCARYVPRSSQRLLFSDQPARRAARAGVHRRSQHQFQLEHDLAGEKRALRRRLDGRNGHSLQVASVPGIRPAGVGHQLSTNHQMEERDVIPDASPRAYGHNGIFRVSSAGTLVGLETPAQSMNLELKPYVVSSLTTDHAAAAPFSDRFSRNAGFDFKYGLTRSLIADATVNTDFAQVEEDVQQINLTRFSLQFPEKRDFFLEGPGDLQLRRGRGAMATTSQSSSSAGGSV